MLVSTFDDFNLESRKKLLYKLYCSTRYISNWRIFSYQRWLEKTARRHSFTRSEDEVFRILKKAQVIGYSGDLVSFVLTGQASIPYFYMVSVGTHLDRINENKTLRDAQLLALPMIALNDL